MAQSQAPAALPLELPPVVEIEAAEVPRTSLAERGVARGEVTLQFRRWFSDGQTAYQRNQCAGFPPAHAERILGVRPLAAVVVNDTSRGMPFGAPVTK